MRFALRGLLASSVLMSLVTPSLATPGWTYPTVTHMPEIDGAAGVSALAVLISVGMIAYNRLRA